VNILQAKRKSTNTGFFCCYFSTSFRSANLNFQLRPKLGRWVSLWTEQKSTGNQESAVAVCHL